MEEGSKYMKMHREMNRAEVFVRKSGKMEKETRLGGPRFVEKNCTGREEVLIWCRKCSCSARQRTGTQIDELLQARSKVCSKRAWQDVETNSDSQKTAGVPVRETKNGRLKDERGELQGRNIKDCLNEFEMEGFMAQKGPWNTRKRENAAGQRGALPEEEGDAVSESTKATHEENSLSSWAEGSWKRQERKKK